MNANAFVAGASGMRGVATTWMVAAVVSIWLIGVAGGAAILWRHAATPGRASEAPPIWPIETNLPRREGRMTLVMFAHPKCPCLRASLSELERLIARSPDAYDVVVAFVKPPGVDQSWTHSSAWSRAQAIAEMKVVLDDGGQEARRFGVATSGDVVIYDQAGQLAFHGGITPARGHEGASGGQLAVLALAQGQPAANCSPSFGCPLLAEPDSPRGN
jgi:hypothetical protein